MKGFSFHSAAEAELTEAAHYYEARSEGLGEEFLTKIRNTVEELRRFPQTAPVVRGNLRRKPVKGFPYSLIYAVEADEIRIYAVSHNRRRPGYWINRI